MREVLIVLFVLIVLILFGLAAYLPWEIAFAVAVGLIVLGFAYGIPTAVVYHVKLRGLLLAAGKRQKGWYWHPVDAHRRLDGNAKDVAWRWFLIAGSGWLCIVMGILLMGSAMLLGVYRAG